MTLRLRAIRLALTIALLAVVGCRPNTTNIEAESLARQWAKRLGYTPLQVVCSSPCAGFCSDTLVCAVHVAERDQLLNVECDVIIGCLAKSCDK